MMGPFQVTCVLAAAVLAAAFSTSTAFAREGRGNPPLPDQPNLGCLHLGCVDGGLADRIASNVIAPVSGYPAESPESWA
jgi:hypothetical protein